MYSNSCTTLCSLLSALLLPEGLQTYFSDHQAHLGASGKWSDEMVQGQSSQVIYAIWSHIANHKPAIDHISTLHVIWCQHLICMSFNWKDYSRAWFEAVFVRVYAIGFCKTLGQIDIPCRIGTSTIVLRQLLSAWFSNMHCCTRWSDSHTISAISNSVFTPNVTWFSRRHALQSAAML